MPKGAFITFEGVEGSGKSTLLRRLAEALESAGRSVDVLREPGGTALGERIRQVVLDAQAPAPVQPWAELFLMLAARAQLVRERVQPALESGHVVLCDRYMDASVAYQGGGRGLGVDAVQRLNELAVGGVVPDVTFLVDLDPEQGRARQTHEPDRMEREHLDFHRAVRSTYLALAASEPARFRCLDGRSSPDRLVETAWSALIEVVEGLPRRMPQKRHE